MLGAQTRHPQAIVGVDAGSADASSRILVESLGHDRVVMLDASSEPAGFGAAIDAGLTSGVLRVDSDETFDVETTEWIWLLHDDSAPAPDCLEQLLLAADAHPTAAILGPKSLGWHDRRLLLEVGFSVTGSGRRVTGLERREHDQGQHDDRGAVHAVGSAGMLVRRDVWDALGGFDPAVPLYRDDLDLCWRAWRAGYEVRVVPEAVIHHREASYHGRREGSADPGQGHRVDRRAALHVLLVQAPAWRLPFTTVRLALGSFLRSLLYLLGKDLRRSADEVAALFAVLAHPGRLAASRRRISATATMSSREAVHDLRPKASTQVRAAVEALGGIMASGRGSGAGSGALESGPVSDDADLFEDPAGGWLRRTLSRPTVIIALILLVLSFIAGRALWWGDGVLFGGALLPSPEGAADLWQSYRASWHDVGPGSFVPAAPAVAALAALSTIVLGKASLAVGLVVFLAPVLAGLVAWAALRGVVTSRAVRAWAALAYALLPALTASQATGRLGALLALIMLPVVIRLLVRVQGLAPALASPTGRTAWAAALAIALAMAGAPVLWLWCVLAAIAGLVFAALGQRLTVVLALRTLVAVVVPLVLLLPWSTYVLAHPTLLLMDVGAWDPALTAPASSPWQLALLDPGGPGVPAPWVGAGLVLAALLAVLRPWRRGVVLAAWAVALVALVLAIGLTAVTVTVPSQSEPAQVWPGITIAVAAAALIVAAAVAGDGLRDSMADSTFSWRQPVSLVATAAAVLTPLAAAVLLLPGWSGPLHRGDPGLLPPFVAAEAMGPEAPRTLVLAPAGGVVGYTLINGTGPTLGDGAVGPPAQDWDNLNRLVSGLVSGRGGDEVIGLAAYAVRYVIVQTDESSSAEITEILDAAPGLRRVAGQDGEVLWRIDAESARVAVVGDTDVTAVPVGDVAAADPLAVGPAPTSGGVVALAQTSAPSWQAFARGEPLAGETIDGLQRFILPAGSTGDVVVQVDSSARTRWLWAQALAIIVVVVLALPGRRRRHDDDVADGEVDEDDVEMLAADGVEVIS